jgi:hypothetical protein
MARPEVRLQIPAHWGELPDSAPWEAEVEWVHVHRGMCIAWTNGLPRIDLFAASKAPSKGALGLMQRAADDPKVFDGFLQYVKKGGSDDESEKKRGEKKSIAEIDKILAKYDD